MSGVAHRVTTRPLDFSRPAAPAPDWPATVWAGVPVAQERPPALHLCRQVHGASVLVADELTGPECATREADALVSDTPNQAIGILVADCVPVLVAAPGGPVGVAHAGWRGTMLGVATNLVARLVSTYGVKAGELHAAIGPSIGPEHYEVGEDVIGALDRSFPADTPHVVERRSGRAYLDLWEANRRQLLASGISPRRIEVAGLSTPDHLDRFYSFRAEGAAAGRFAAAIWVLPER